MAPSYTVLSLIFDLSNIDNQRKMAILYEKMNCPEITFNMIIEHLQKKKGINITHRQHENLVHPTLPNKYWNMNISLTEYGKEFVKKDIKGIEKRRIDFGQTSDLEFLEFYEGPSFHLPQNTNITFDNLKDLISGGKNQTDIRIIYYMLTGKTAKLDPLTVFISYSWDDDQHKAWVKRLAGSLKKKGFNVILDVLEKKKAGKNPHELMKNWVLQSDKVILILTPGYKSKSTKKGSGVNYEYSILRNDLYQMHSNDKYIPILRQGSHKVSIPRYMKNLWYIDMADQKKYKSSFKELEDELK